MRTFFFAIHDTAVKAFARPFPMASEAAAIRAFSAVVNDPKSDFHNSPGDYSLHYLGAFDDTHGVFTCDACPRQIATGLSVYNGSLPTPGQAPLPYQLNGGGE